MQYCLQTCCYLGSSISKNLFPGFHGPPRSEGFVPPSLTEPVRSDTNNTSDTSSTPVLAASSPDQIFSNPPTKVSSSTSSVHVSTSPSTHVFSRHSPFNIAPISEKEFAELMSEFLSDYTTPPPKTNIRCEKGKGCFFVI